MLTIVFLNAYFKTSVWVDFLLFAVVMYDNSQQGQLSLQGQQAPSPLKCYQRVALVEFFRV